MMTVKTFLFGLLIALITAFFAAGLTIVGTNMLKDENGTSTAITSLFKSSEESEVEFVEIKNLVITLKSDGSKEHYLLLELALVTDDPKNSKRTEEMTPAIRGAAVSLLSDMDYDTVRSMSEAELREKILAAATDRFNKLHNSLPFKDVIITKMVFQ